MRIIPRPAQRLATKAALRGLRGPQKRALVVLATGLGKTFASAFIAKEYRAPRILFLVHNNFILEHAFGEYRQVFKRKIMAVFNGLSKNGANKADIVFATWQTMGNNLLLWDRDHFDLVIVDEAHHSEAETYRPTLEYFTGAKLGITATPDREDKADIRAVFGPEVINITLEEAIARGWLPRIEYHVVTDKSLDEEALQKIASEIRRGKKRFTMAEVNRRLFIKKRDEEIAKIIGGYSEKAIVFCASIHHAEQMHKVLRSSSTFHSKVGNSQMDTWRKNQEVLARLKDGRIRRVCAINAFNEGVDVPSVGLVAFCRVTGVLTVFRQQLGRGLRPGKDKLIVLDFVGNLERIQLVLEMMNRISDLHEKYTSKDERKREGYERERFEVSGKGFKFTFSDKIVDLMEVLEHVDRDLYPTWQEASEAAKKLGITGSKEYRIKKKYKLDPKLPADPHLKYKDFPGYAVFFGGRPRKEGREYYPTWKTASKAARILQIKNREEYRIKRKQDSKLPARPEEYYCDFPGFPSFLGNARGQGIQRRTYGTWRRAALAAKRAGIRSKREYDKRYRKDPLLPSDPRTKYENFPGWLKFLGKN